MLDEARVFLGFQVVEEDVRQEKFLAEVLVEVVGLEFFVTAEDAVHLVEVALDDGEAGDALHLVDGGQGLVVGLAVGFADLDVFGAEILAQLVEVERDGEARAVAHEHAAGAVIDGAARAGHEDAALVLFFLGFVVAVVAEELAVGEAAAEREQDGRDEKIKEEDAGVVALVGFDQPAGALCGLVRHAKALECAAARGVAELGAAKLEQTSLHGEKPGGDEDKDELGDKQVGEIAHPSLAGVRSQIHAEEGQREKEAEVGEQRGDYTHDGFVAGRAGADVEDHGMGGEEEQGVRAEGDGRARV